MMHFGRGITSSLLAALSVIGLAAVSLRADAQIELLTNGNFETGDLTGWTSVDQLNPADTLHQDHFYVSTPGTNTPAVNGVTFATAANPAGGSFYAVTASDDPGAHALLQDFTVPAGDPNVALKFQMFVNDQSGIGPIVDPSGLDYTTGGTFTDNQHARVDLLRVGAGALSTAPADVLANFYLNVDPINIDPNGNLIPNPYTSYTFNLAPFVVPGDTYILRFAEVDNDGAINMGVDNVQVLASGIQSVPEPGPVAMLVGSLAGVGLALRRARSARGRY